jgi:hypothetical protein
MEAGMIASVLMVGDSFGMCFVFAVVAGVIALVIWSINRQKKVREAWLQFARGNQLQVQGSQHRPTIQGWYGPVWITLNTVVRGSGKNRTTYTQHHATINAPMPQGLVLYKEGFFSKMGKMMGGQDVQTGDRQLDDAFIIKGQDLLGIHDLLNLPPVKQALLYMIARYPGMRLDGRAVLIENTGMTGDLNRLQAIFSDLSYLVQTLDAAYQELVSRQQGPTVAAPPRTQTADSGRRKAAKPSKAAPAEILGGALFEQPVTRPAARDEDPATRAAFAQMADVLHQYEAKLESGEAKPRKGREKADFGADAFSNEPSSALFSTSDGDARNALENYDPRKAWESRPAETEEASHAFDNPDAGDAFADPVPVETTPTEHAHKEQKEQKDAATGGFSGLLARLGDRGSSSGDREKLIESNKGTSWEVELSVDRVDSTWGFDVPDNLRDGKTVEGLLKDGGAKVAIRFPKSRNNEIGALKSGETLKAMATLTGWDDLFKKATLDAG